MKCGLRRRALSILLLPIVIFIFIIGWSLSWIGEEHTRNGVKAPERETANEESKSDESVEVGLVENLMERMREVE